MISWSYYKIQSRICIPASDVIAGRFGEGVEEIIGMKTGERGSRQITRNMLLT